MRFASTLVMFGLSTFASTLGQVGTQFDGPGHIGMRMKMEDGDVEDVYYNGFTGDEIYSPYGLRKLGVENVKSIVTRGILIDLPAYKGVETLPDSYEVTVKAATGSIGRPIAIR